MCNHRFLFKEPGDLKWYVTNETIIIVTYNNKLSITFPHGPRINCCGRSGCFKEVCSVYSVLNCYLKPRLSSCNNNIVHVASLHIDH